jgi:hypothetical protein
MLLARLAKKNLTYMTTINPENILALNATLRYGLRPNIP